MSHRGIQDLGKVQMSNKTRKRVFCPKFEFRIDCRFGEVLEACAHRPGGKPTWITPELLAGYLQLHEMGYAHSFECWEDGCLVGGAFGIQIGGMMSCDSMFHRVSNAGIFAWGQALLRMKDRGYAFVDVNCVTPAFAQFGEEWVPQWRFEGILRSVARMRRPPSLDDAHVTPSLPTAIRMTLPIAWAAGGIYRRLWGIMRG